MYFCLYVMYGFTTEGLCICRDTSCKANVKNAIDRVNIHSYLENLRLVVHYQDNIKNNNKIIKKIGVLD